VGVIVMFGGLDMSLGGGGGFSSVRTSLVDSLALSESSESQSSVDEEEVVMEEADGLRFRGFLGFFCVLSQVSVT